MKSDYGVPYGTSDSVKHEWIVKEKRHGLPESTCKLPRFLTPFDLAWRSAGFVLAVLQMGPYCWLFCTHWHKDDINWVMGMGICVVLAAMVYMQIAVDVWYPVPKGLTKDGLRRFLVFLDWLKLACSLTAVFMMLTPLFRFLADGYFENLYNLEYDDRRYHNFELEWYHYVFMPLFAWIALGPFVSVVFRPLSGRKSVDSRWEYMRYKMGQLSEAEKERMAEIDALGVKLDAHREEVKRLEHEIEQLRGKMLKIKE